MKVYWLILGTLAILSWSLLRTQSHAGNSSPKVLQSPTASTGNRTNDMMLASPESVQLLALQANVNHAYPEDQCTGTRVFYMGVGDQEGYWTIGCSNGRSYEIRVKNDTEGTSEVVDCQLLKALGVDACFHTVEELKATAPDDRSRDPRRSETSQQSDPKARR